MGKTALPGRICELCGKKFPKEHCESKARYAVRRFCSRLCYDASRCKTHPPCAICAGPVGRRDGENVHNYLKRKTCCNACYTELQAQNNRQPAEIVPWPKVERVDWDGCFARHNIAVAESGRIGLPAPTWVPRMALT